MAATFTSSSPRTMMKNVSALRASPNMRAPITSATSSNTPNNNNNNNNNNNMGQRLLICTPADTTVDYDTNVTSLYEHIGNSDWNNATTTCRNSPHEAATWVVRYQRDSNGKKVPPGDVVQWRFLPIHSACALNPPTSFLRALLQSHPAGARTLDDQGMLPLHYACGAKCSREVLYLLLMSFPQAALKEDPNGMLPLHYLAQWGPREGSSSEAGVVDMVCVATGHKVANAKDGDGNTAEMLARRAEYVGSEEVTKKIHEFATRHAAANGLNGGSGVGAVGTTGTGKGTGKGNGIPRSPVPSNLKTTPLSAINKPSPSTPARSVMSTGSFNSHRKNPSAYKRGIHLSVTTSPSIPRNLSAKTDKYSSFEDDAAELIDESTIIEHEPEGDIEISLSNTLLSPSLAKNNSGVSSVGGKSNAENNSENKNNPWDYERNSNNNDAMLAMLVTPRSGKDAMSKLGVSPVHHHTRYQSKSETKNKDRYLSWDGHQTSCSGSGNAGGDGGAGSSSNQWDGGLNQNDGNYGGSPSIPPRPSRSFSWDQGNPTRPSDDSAPVVTALFSNEPRNAANANAVTSAVSTTIQNSPSLPSIGGGGSTWTTNMDLPASTHYPDPGSSLDIGTGSTALHGSVGSEQQQSHQVRSSSTPRGLTAQQQQQYLHHRSSSAPRGFTAPSSSSPGDVIATGSNTFAASSSASVNNLPPSNSFAASSSAPVNHLPSSNSFAAPSSAPVNNLPSSNSFAAPSSASSVNGATTNTKSYGFPPLSPRATPKSRNQRKWNYTPANSQQASPSPSQLPYKQQAATPPQSNQQPYQAPIQEQEDEREPANSGMSEQERQDRRLSELREELSGRSSVKSSPAPDCQGSSIGDRDHSAGNSDGYGGSHAPGSFAPSSYATDNNTHYPIASGSWNNCPNEGNNGAGSVFTIGSTVSGSAAQGDYRQQPASQYDQNHVAKAGNDQDDVASVRSVRSVRSKSSHSSSSNHTNTSYGTQLTQQLRTLTDADKREKREKKQEVRRASQQAEEQARNKLRLETQRLKAENDRQEELQRLESEKEKLMLEAGKEAVERQEQLQKHELQQDIARLESEKERVEQARHSEERLQQQKLKADRERAEAVHRLQAEKAQSENALMDEIAKLRADKERAEAVLTKITTMGPGWSMSESDSREEGEDEDHDDGVSKLTFLEHDVDRENLTEVLMKSKSAAECSSSVISKSGQDSVMSAMAAKTTTQITDLKQQVKVEKAKSMELKGLVALLKNKLESANQLHGEAVYEHLQVVKSLRESLDRANVEIEKHSASGCQSKSGTDEREWNVRHKKLEEEIKVTNDKCWSAQNEEHKLRTQLKGKESQWAEERLRLEAEIRKLKGGASGSDSFSVASATRSVNSFGLSAGNSSADNTGPNKEVQVEINDLNDKCWKLQDAEHKVQALMKDKELQWDEERVRLEAEIKMLKETAGSDSFSVVSPARLDDSASLYGMSVGMSSVNTRKINEFKNTAMKMQLDGAVKEAEDLRKFNTAIRKEHNETIAELESELESERRGKTESLSQIVTLQYQIATLEQDLEDAKEEAARAASQVSVMSSSMGGSDHTDRKVEMELYELKVQLRKKLDDAEKSRKVLDDMKLELKAKEREMEASSRELMESMKLKFHERERMLQQQLETRLDSMKLEFEERKSSRDAIDEFQEKEKPTQHGAEQFEFKERDMKLQREAEMLKNLLDSLKLEFKERERKWQQELEAAEDRVQQLKLEFKERERRLQQELEEANSRVQQLEASQALGVKEEQQNSCTYSQQIRDLKKKIELLEQNSDELSQQLRDANKLRERALQDKEDECAATVRELKVKHEKLLIEKEDSHLEDIREVKKRSEQSFRVQEESYLRQLRDAKKKEKKWIEEEDALRQEMKHEKMKDSYSEIQIEKLIQQKEEEFEKGIENIIQVKEMEFEEEVDKLQTEIKRLRKQSKESTEDKMIANELETQLLECKKELKRQSRKQRSEMNKLSNTMEMQKSKEGRLQSHIISLEKQITDMVNDYETRLQEAFYDNM